MEAEVINGTDRLANPIASVIIGAMTPHNAISYIQDKALLIVPGDRDDVVLAAISVELTRTDVKLAGILFGVADGLFGRLGPLERTRPRLAARAQRVQQG
jgi:BioD-like phosphotransacetylase family protein